MIKLFLNLNSSLKSVERYTIKINTSKINDESPISYIKIGNIVKICGWCNVTSAFTNGDLIASGFPNAIKDITDRPQGIGVVEVINNKSFMFSILENGNLIAEYDIPTGFYNFNGLYISQ